MKAITPMDLRRCQRSPLATSRHLALIRSGPPPQDPHLSKRDEQAASDLDTTSSREVPSVTHPEPDALTKHIEALMKMSPLRVRTVREEIEPLDP